MQYYHKTFIWIFHKIKTLGIRFCKNLKQKFGRRNREREDGRGKKQVKRG